MTVALAQIEYRSPAGPFHVVWDRNDGSIVGVLFEARRALVRRYLTRSFGAVVAHGDGVEAAEILAPFDRYFDGDLRALDGVEVELRGTAFQRRAWRALRDIPPGTTTTYAALAAAIGAPRAARAVGAANGANPLSLVLPCHRVVGADGRLTGYGGGLPMKAWLLRHEGAGDFEGAQ